MEDGKRNRIRQADLIKVFRNSLRKKGTDWIIQDATKFKFSLHRLNPRRDVLRRIALLLNSRPDLSWVLAAYLKKFEKDAEAADILLAARRRDPTYDPAAANYIEAMDVCEPEENHTRYRRVIETANRRSEEKSILLRIASSSFGGRRRSAAKALKLIESEPDRRAQGILAHRLFGTHPSAPFQKTTCKAFLESCTESPDPDLTRFGAAHLLDDWPWVAPSWRPTKAANRSVALLLQGLGLRRRTPSKRGVLDQFFQERYKIGLKIPWRKVLGRDWRETERRCLKFQRLLLGDPTARITLLDTFNELLLQNFSARHPAVETAYAKAIPPNAKVPELGNWLTNPSIGNLIPRATKWFHQIHSARVDGELAHAKARKSGKVTRPISFMKAERLMKGAQVAWAELLTEWKRIVQTECADTQRTREIPASKGVSVSD